MSDLVETRIDYRATTAARSRPAAAERESSLIRHPYSKALLLLFLFSLPLVNPWVRGDGVGYYAYVRSLLIEHHLNFENDWRAGNLSFTMGRVRPDGTIDPRQYTSTGHLDNHFAVGPAILWTPFLVPVHLAVLTLDRLGLQVKPNGYSASYTLAMALSTALYGFLGLYLSFRLACLYVEKQWAFLATLGVWFASSLPVYMYFNPSWSHAHSVFIVAAFLWYWHETRPARTLLQWIFLGLISGLMVDVYYPNFTLLLVPLLESLGQYRRSLRGPARDWSGARQLLAANLIYVLATLAAFSPTLITRKIIYGNPFDFGYGEVGGWRWDSPHLTSALFSSEHGLLLWTPILILAVMGLLLFLQRNRTLAAYLVAVLVAFCYFIGGDPNWAGISSFGNRFFISLTPLFVLGLAVWFSSFASWLRRGRAVLPIAGSITTAFILWNLAFIFQWGIHLVPPRGPISWRQMAYNQVAVVPGRLLTEVKSYIGNRGALMQQIEREDVKQLRQEQAPKGP